MPNYINQNPYTAARDRGILRDQSQQAAQLRADQEARDKADYARGLNVDAAQREHARQSGLRGASQGYPQPAAMPATIPTAGRPAGAEGFSVEQSISQGRGGYEPQPVPAWDGKPVTPMMAQSDPAMEALFNTPGAGRIAMEAMENRRKQREDGESKAITALAAGDFTTYQYWKERSGLVVPPGVEQDRRTAQLTGQAMTLGKEYYASSPQQAQMFTRTFIQSGGDMMKAFDAAGAPQEKPNWSTLDLVQDGKTVLAQISDTGEVRIPTAADGQPYQKPGSGSRSTPSQVQLAEWLVDKGIADNPEEAWLMATNAKGDRVARAKLIQAEMSRLSEINENPLNPNERMTPEQIRAQAIGNVDDWMGQATTQAPVDGQGQPQTGAPVPAQAEAPQSAPQTAGSSGGAFDSAGSGYDYDRARLAGMNPDGTGDNAGHWGSVAPTTAAEQQSMGLPKDSYIILKGQNHPTWDKAINAEKNRGFKIVEIEGRFYSVPDGWNDPSASGGTSQPASTAIPQAPRDPSLWEPNTTYMTPKGPAVYLGNNEWQLQSASPPPAPQPAPAPPPQPPVQAQSEGLTLTPADVQFMQQNPGATDADILKNRIDTGTASMADALAYQNKAGKASSVPPSPTPAPQPAPAQPESINAPVAGTDQPAPSANPEQQTAALGELNRLVLILRSEGMGSDKYRQETARVAQAYGGAEQFLKALNMSQDELNSYVQNLARSPHQVE